MVMLNRELSAEEAKQLLETRMPISNVLFDLINEPRYRYVRYRAAFNRIDYERLDTYYNLGPETPSDSLWMVPQW